MEIVLKGYAQEYREGILAYHRVFRTHHSQPTLDDARENLKEWISRRGTKPG